MSLKGKRVLVTGAGGFVGSHLAEDLVGVGATVTALVRYNSRNDWGLLEGLPADIREEINVVPGDLRDPDAVRRLCKDQHVVFHLGALIAIPYSYVNPREYVDTNVVGTFNVLAAALDNEVERVVHTSTSEVYGTAQYTPIDEKHPLQGQSPYSASKIGADKMAESFHLAYELPVVTLRPFNTYGPRQSARAVIPTIISQALAGDTIRLGSLTPTRDLNYVKDTGRGFMLAAESKDAIGQTLNVGAGKTISIGELAEKILALLGKECEIVQDKDRIRPESSEVMVLVAETSKAAEVMGWRPEVSLDDGLRRTIDYIRDNLSKYKPDIYNL